MAVRFVDEFFEIFLFFDLVVVIIGQVGREETVAAVKLNCFFVVNSFPCFGHTKSID